MLNKKRGILVVDDDPAICELLEEELATREYDCEIAGDAGKALSILAKHQFDAALLDIRLPDMNGIDLLKQINANYPSLASLMLTAVNDINTAVEAMKNGAVDYITKPFDFDRLDAALDAAISKKRLGQNADPAIAEIEALALGVEARQEMLDIHSEIVIQQTIDLARSLSLPEEKIQKWAAYRKETYSRKVKQVNESISKFIIPPSANNQPQ